MNSNDMTDQLETMANAAACPSWCDQNGCDECGGGRQHITELVPVTDGTGVDLASWVGFDGEVREPKAGLWFKGETLDDGVVDTRMTTSELREVGQMMLEAADRMDEVLGTGAAS